MRPHCPVAEPRTAFETGRLFFCCPQWWPRCVSRSPVLDLWSAGCIKLLSQWRPKKDVD